MSLLSQITTSPFEFHSVFFKDCFSSSFHFCKDCFSKTFFSSSFQELIGVAYNRLIKMDINSGDSQKTWRYSTMTAWHVNWEVKEVLVQMEDENIQFSCSSADCKVVHEFIGGYIFLSMRSLDSNQTLNKEMFHKLTGGWV